MAVLFIGKRFYTNRDALTERFGRIYQLPYHWARSGTPTRLWLVDYHTTRFEERSDGHLQISSTPLLRWRMASRTLRELFNGLRSKVRADTIVASGDCYVGILGYLLARLTRARFVFDVYDKYDEFAGYRRLWRFDPLTFLLMRSDAVTFASHALAERIGTDIRERLVVPNGIDTHMFRPLDKNRSREQLGLPAAPALVGYFGSMEPARGVDDLVAALELVRSTRPDVELVVAGQTRPDLDLDRVWIHYLGNLPFDSVPIALGACDLLSMPYRNSPFLDMASSCKIAEYFAAQRPVVATRTPNLVENFPVQANELDAFLAQPGNAKEIAQTIHDQLEQRRLASMPEQMDWQSISANAVRLLRQRR